MMIPGWHNKQLYAAVIENEEYADILGKVILFGSYSRGEAGEQSDIDLYIEPNR